MTHVPRMFDIAEPNNVAKDGYGGIFFYDDTTGVTHGFSPLSWMILYYATGKADLRRRKAVAKPRSGISRIP